MFKKQEKVKKLDMTTVSCPVCEILMERIDDEVVCPKCGFTSPILQVVRRRGKT